MALHVGIVGFGRIGAEHERWINATSSARAVAAVDATPARRDIARQRGGLAALEHLDDLLDDSSIDAVLVALPTAMHFEHASRALEAGKHVMVEKPVTLNLDEAQRLAALAHQRGRVLSVFHNRRWDLDYLTVLQAVQSGVFGRIINVESRLGQWASCVGPAATEWRPGWRNEGAFGGGGLYDWGSHFVDQIWQLMLPAARPVRVFAQLRGNVWSTDCDDFARVCIDFDNGAVGLVEINTTTTRPLPRWHIDGTHGSAESAFSLTFDTRTWAALDFTSSDGANRTLPVATKGLDEVQIWEQFAAACRGDGPPAVDMQSVMVTMEILDAARKSSQIGQAVRLEAGSSARH